MIRKYKTITARIQMLELRLAELKEKRDCLGGGDGHGSGIADPTGRNAVAIIDYARRIEELKQEAEAERQEVIERLYSLEDGDEITILRKRYVECKPWEQISRETYMSLSTLFRKHDSGLRHYEAQEEDE